jgi:hypothetical protein
MTREDIDADSQNIKQKIDVQNQSLLTDKQWTELKSVFYSRALTNSVVYTNADNISDEENFMKTNNTIFTTLLMSMSLMAVGCGDIEGEADFYDDSDDIFLETSESEALATRRRRY